MHVFKVSCPFQLIAVDLPTPDAGAAQSQSFHQGPGLRKKGNCLDGIDGHCMDAHGWTAQRILSMEPVVDRISAVLVAHVVAPAPDCRRRLTYTGECWWNTSFQPASRQT